MFVITSGSQIQEDDSNLYVTNQLFLRCWPDVVSGSQAENRRLGNGTGYCNSVGVQECVIM